MISDERKKELIEEESFRLGIRQELSSPMPESLTIWKFFNSNLGLLLVSSVLISLFTWGYNQFEDHRKSVNENIENVRMLRIELSFRAESLPENVPDKLVWEDFYDYMFIFDGTPKDWIPKPVYPEFKERAVPGLTYELFARSDGTEQSAVKVLFDLSLQISKIHKNLMRASISDERDGESTLRQEDIEQFRKANELFRQFRNLKP